MQASSPAVCGRCGCSDYLACRSGGALVTRCQMCRTTVIVPLAHLLDLPEDRNAVVLPLTGS